MHRSNSKMPTNLEIRIISHIMHYDFKYRQNDTNFMQKYTGSMLKDTRNLLGKSCVIIRRVIG
jgi:hypothetical protein